MIDYVERFSDAELGQVIEEGLIYMCACPAQVAAAMRKLRELYCYQLNCLTVPGSVSIVHHTIARATAAAHEELQVCLERVIELEQWDRATLCMPEGLRRRQMQEFLDD